MNVKKYLKVLPVMAAMLLTLACSNQDIALEEELQPGQARIIPFKASVSTDIKTRATLGSEEGSYVFEDDDKLYVWGENVTGELSMTENGVYPIFEGNLYWTGEGDYPPENHPLNAAIKSSSDEILGTLGEFKARSFEPQYSQKIAGSNMDAVKNFSFITGSDYYSRETYYNTSFSEMTQQTSFISFEITLDDGTAVGTEVGITITNDGTTVNTGTATTVKDEKDNIKVKFVAGYKKGTKLKSATVKLDSRNEISFGGSTTLAANVFYRVKKGYPGYSITAEATIPSMLVSIVGSESKTKTICNMPMGYTTTLSALLNEIGAGSMASMVSGCEKKGDGTSVDVSYNNVVEDFIFTVVGVGLSEFEMTAMGFAVPVKITVSSMTP